MALNSSDVAAGQDATASQYNNLIDDVEEHTHEGSDTAGVHATIIAAVNAGEAVGANKAVYMDDTDNEWKLADGNDTGKLEFVGFSIEAGTDGNAMKVATAGVLGGFSGLDAGKKYYLSDTAGEISTTKGTYEIYVGIAISTTQLLIHHAPRSSAIMAFPSSEVFASGAVPTSWTDLDLSSVVGVTTALVFLKVTHDNSNAKIRFRTNGDTDEIYDGASASGSTADDMYVTVITDSAGVVEWNCEAAATGVVTLLAYLKIK